MQFRQTMRDYVNKDSLNNVVDFLHALLGFCMEPVTDSKYRLPSLAFSFPVDVCLNVFICVCAMCEFNFLIVLIE